MSYEDSPYYEMEFWPTEPPAPQHTPQSLAVMDKLINRLMYKLEAEGLGERCCKALERGERLRRVAKLIQERRIQFPDCERT
jgi:hypothetical protein